MAPQQKGPTAPPVAVAGQRHSATDPGTGVAGTVGLVSKAWGTQVTLDLSKVRGPVECELVAVSKTGNGGWPWDGWYPPLAMAFPAIQPIWSWWAAPRSR